MSLSNIINERFKEKTKDKSWLYKNCPYSVTKIVELCKAEFDKEKVSKQCFEKYYEDVTSPYYHKTQEEILEMWELKSKKGKDSGSALDDYIGSILNEDLRQQKLLYDKCVDEKIKSKFNTFKALYEKEFLGNGFEFVCREGIIYDDKHKWKGRFDAIFVKGDTIVIIDWKNNEKITTENNFQNMRGTMYKYPSTDLNGYTVQLYLYKYAMRNVLGFKDMDIKTIICRVGSGEYEFFAPQIEYSDELVEDILSYAIGELDKVDK